MTYFQRGGTWDSLNCSFLDSIVADAQTFALVGRADYSCRNLGLLLACKLCGRADLCLLRLHFSPSLTHLCVLDSVFVHVEVARYQDCEGSVLCPGWLFSLVILRYTMLHFLGIFAIEKQQNFATHCFSWIILVKKYDFYIYVRSWAVIPELMQWDLCRGIN